MSGLQRRVLAGRDRGGKLRESGPRFHAAGLLKRLADHMPSTREALKWTSEQWAGFMERHQEERKLPATERKMADICRNPQERIIMETIGVAFSLDTSHHPTLLDTAPHLLRWCRDVLGYVVVLEDSVEANERTIADLGQKLAASEDFLEMVKLERDHMRDVEVPDIAQRLDEAMEQLDRERARATARERDLQRDLTAAESTCAAWRLSAQTNALAVSLLRREGLVVDLEVVPGGKLLPAVRS